MRAGERKGALGVCRVLSTSRLPDVDAELSSTLIVDHRHGPGQPLGAASC